MVEWDEFSERVRDLETREIAPALSSVFMALPGLRGLWLTAPSGSTGQAFDLSGNGRTLTYNGNPTYNSDNLVPYIALDGTGDWLSRADEVGLDILGTETYVAPAVQGLSMGGWFYFDTAVGAAAETCIGKWGAVGQYSYRILRDVATPLFFCQISADGTAIRASGSRFVRQDTWIFGAMAYDPSTELVMYTGGQSDDGFGNVSYGLVRDVFTVLIPAALFNSNADLRIGANGAGTELVTGRASLCFLCATFLSSSIIESIFDQTRGAFGV